MHLRKITQKMLTLRRILLMRKLTKVILLLFLKVLQVLNHRKNLLTLNDQVEHDGEELAEKSKDVEAEKTAEDKHKDKIKEINVKEDVDALINGPRRSI